MGSAFIIVGDKTSHGGTVIAGTNFSLTGGQPLARRGDQVYCPRCKKMTVIIEGDQAIIVDGEAVALDGHKTSCGAVLISSQRPTTKEYGSSAANTNANSFASFFSPYVAEEDDVRMKFNDKYQLLDEMTNQPMADTEYAVVRESGDVEHGTSDANGHTHLLSSIINSEPVKIYIGTAHA
jgi:uncharacterized Zn-binding protein involved in type VI secretion